MLFQPAAPSELYTAATLFTQAGMTFGAWVIPSVLVAVSPGLQRSAKFMTLILSIVLAFIAAFIVDGQFRFVPDMLKVIAAVVNGFVVAAGALGINQAGDRLTGQTLAGKSGFWRSWL
jgi:nitrate/nitrite transporter NarK